MLIYNLLLFALQRYIASYNSIKKLTFTLNRFRHKTC